MKVKLVNVFQSQGISKKDGRPFSMQRVTILSDFDTVSTQNYQRDGCGFGVVEVSVTDKFYPELERHVSQNFKGQLLELDLKTSLGRRGEMTICGFEGTTGTVPGSLSGPKMPAAA